jgi:mannitol-specific phosphotransferase system IIBC component
VQMKEKVKKEKKLRTPIQLNLKVNIGIIVAIVVAIFIAIPLLKGKEASKREAMQIITESNLHKIIEVSQLSTYECVYNDVCTVMDKEDSSKIAYYCKYNGRVKAGIDFSKVEIAVKEQEDGLLLITVTLPEVTLGEPEVDITSLKYMFMEDSADNNTVSGEAYDIKKKSQSEELIYDTAQENAVNIVKGLVEPFIKSVETSEKQYEVKIVTTGEYTK